MDIRLLSGFYKSLTEFEWLNVPMFAVVTGPNGSGKTQIFNKVKRGNYHG
jgi:ABC-type branched-subunit amino acid transport system ATPase component